MTIIIQLIPEQFAYIFGAMCRVLALSSSRAGNSTYLEPYRSLIADFLGKQSLSIAFIPFASVDRQYEKYTIAVQAALCHLP
jgi:peptidase E